MKSYTGLTLDLLSHDSIHGITHDMSSVTGMFVSARARAATPRGEWGIINEHFELSRKRERANGQIKSTGTWWDLISKCKSLQKLNLERLTVRLGLTVIYFPIFRQARPDFFRDPEEVRPCLTKYWKIYYS